ncbi:integrase core domain protein-like protein, partial [Dinothrombium tinctorium]
MWLKLQVLNQQKSKTSVHLLQQQFFDYKMDPNDSIAAHITKVETLSKQLKELGSEQSETAIITKILCSLPSSYRNVISAWDSTSKDQRTVNELTARLLKEEALLKQWESGISKQDALLAKGKRKFKQNHKTSIEDKKKKSNCGYCKRRGHWWRECRKRLSEVGKESNDHVNVSATKQASSAFSAELKKISEKPNDNWYLDSGATEHMTSRRDWFTTFEPILNKSHSIRLGDNHEVFAKGKGTVTIHAIVGNEWTPHQMLNVLYVPELKKNLFSIGATTDKGVECRFKGNRVTLWKDNVLKIVGILQAAIKDITNVDSIEVDEFFCEGCAYGKNHRLPFKKDDKKRAELPGELIHADVCGPMSTPSVGKS